MNQHQPTIQLETPVHAPEGGNDMIVEYRWAEVNTSRNQIRRDIIIFNITIYNNNTLVLGYRSI